MLPAAIISIAIYAVNSLGSNMVCKISCFLKLLVSMIFCIIIIFSGYIIIFKEDLVSMLKILTIGNQHTIRLDVFFRYLLCYIAATLVPTIVLFQYQKNKVSLALLHFLGLIFILFASKDGGSWHHFMSLVLPWGGYIFGSKYNNRMTNHFWITAPALAVCFIGFILMFRPALASREDIDAAKNLYPLLASKSPLNGEIMIFDTDNAFAFPDAQYKYKFKTKWNRGALEEWSSAEKKIPNELIIEISEKQFQNIIIRGSPSSFPSASAYGVPYKNMNEVILLNYKECNDNIYFGWVTYCPKK
jgi:hypothetical protein